MRCKKCGRRLSDPVSISYGYGPECIKTAVQLGQVPLIALTATAAYKRSIRFRTGNEYVDLTGDLFGDDEYESVISR